MDAFACACFVPGSVLAASTMGIGIYMIIAVGYLDALAIGVILMMALAYPVFIIIMGLHYISAKRPRPYEMR